MWWGVLGRDIVLRWRCWPLFWWLVWLVPLRVSCSGKRRELGDEWSKSIGFPSVALHMMTHLSLNRNAGSTCALNPNLILEKVRVQGSVIRRWHGEVGPDTGPDFSRQIFQGDDGGINDYNVKFWLRCKRLHFLSTSGKIELRNFEFRLDFCVQQEITSDLCNHRKRKTSISHKFVKQNVKKRRADWAIIIKRKEKKKALEKNYSQRRDI